MPELTRRRLLGGAAGAAAAAAAATLMPPNVQQALAATPPSRGSLNDIKHIVLLMQDHQETCSESLCWSELDQRAA